MSNLKKILFITLLVSTTIAQPKPPRLTVVFIVDQFAYSYVDKVKPNLTGGIHTFFKKGIFYKNAYIPHAYPATAAGHVTTGTGTYPSTHGIIGNRWLNKQGEAIKYENLNVNPKHKEFSPDGLYPHAVSSKNIMVDGVSDQFVLSDKPDKHCKAYAVSHKSRAAIGVAGKLGKAIWFDPRGRQFTSSKAYFKQLPAWLSSFNKKYLTQKIPEALTWKPFFLRNHAAYQFPYISNYKFSAHPFSLINNPFHKIKKANQKNGSFSIDKRTTRNNDYSELYIKTPHANQHLLDLAKTCIDNNFSYKKNDKFMIWISLSPLDPLGHYYGPYSKEVIDMIYHIDWQIKQFMKELHKKINPREILYILTADHGVMPIIELLHEKGMKNAHRINETKLIQKLNEYIKQKHDVSNIISCFRNTTFHVNKPIFYRLTKEHRSAISRSIKAFLRKQSGISDVWTADELKNLPAPKGSINWFFKNQYFKGRSGEFICKCHPYCVITKHKLGTQHQTPYEYDTHVPLVIYQKEKLQNKTIEDKVFITQLANTMAKILGINKPSASTENVLPGI